MNKVLQHVERFTKYMEAIAGFFLVFMVAITTVDVILRALGRPIPGTYEIVALSGGLVIGLALPVTAWVRGMIFVDALFSHLSDACQRGLHILTRLMSVIIFAFVAWNLVVMGSDMKRAGEVSLTLELPIWAVPYGISFGCVVLCVVLIVDAFRMPPKPGGVKRTQERRNAK
jgi:TRAP-type C4-dicarboxylate transport system permease small subunit